MIRTLIVLCACFGLPACGMFAAPFKMYAVASQMAPGDLACPSQRVSAMNRSRELAFHGCGRYVVYRCMSLVSDLSETQCVPVAMDTDAP